MARYLVKVLFVGKDCQKVTAGNSSSDFERQSNSKKPHEFEVKRWFFEEFSSALSMKISRQKQAPVEVSI